MPNALINGVELYYETHGNGLPLVLVAGLGSDSQSWQPILDALSKQYLVITFDNRGVGRTGPQDVELSVPLIADDCVALIRHLGFSSVYLLGHSMGGLVALELATRFPDIAQKLIFAATSVPVSSRNKTLFRRWASWLESGMELEPWFRSIFFWLFSARFFENTVAVADTVRFAVEYPYPQSAIAFRNQVEAIANYSCSGLAKVCPRTLVLGGQEDLLFPLANCARMAQEIPGATFKVIDNAAHSLHWEEPQAFAKSVLEFLADS